MEHQTFFYDENKQLTCDGVPLQAIAGRVGTPLYVYSAARMLANAERLKAAFAPLGAQLHYSLKANSNLSLIRRLHQAGLGMDAVSWGEVQRALKVGVPPAEIVLAGVGKTPAELRQALAVGVGWFNVESHQELELLNHLAAESGTVARVALRVNPNVQAQTHQHIATGHGKAKFGIPADAIPDILAHRERYPAVRIQGLHVHIGSQLANIQASVAAIQRAKTLADDLRMLNIGGGFPVNYEASDEYPSITAFAEAIIPHLEGWQVKLEPGRYIMADAGALVTTVLYTKNQGGAMYAIVDASMSEFIRPALYGAVHPIHPLQHSGHASQATIVAGPVCETADVLHPGAMLPPLNANDGLALLMAGAYGMVMASNYNQRPLPPEVLVEDNDWHLIRKQQPIEDLWRLETLA